MAAPACAASAALVRQYYLEGYYPSGTPNPSNSISPSGALVKATLLLSTRDMTNVSGYPNYNEGWGRICLDDALYFSGDSRKLWIDDYKIGLDTGDSVKYYIKVNSSSQSFKIVLVWHDTAAAANANPTLVNNLNLRVKDPGNNTYWGNYFSGGQSVPGGSADTRNNVEVFLLNSPQVGVYEITVLAQNVPTGAKQPYAITAAGDIEPYVKVEEGKEYSYERIKSEAIVKEKIKISYSISLKGEVLLKIYDIGGRIIREFNEGKKEPGNYEIIWDLKDKNGRKISKGKYFYKIFINGKEITRSFIVIE